MVILRYVLNEDVSLPLSDEDKNTLKEMRQFLINSQDDDIAKNMVYVLV